VQKIQSLECDPIHTIGLTNVMWYILIAYCSLKYRSEA
jgi:hypothetical protein